MKSKSILVALLAAVLLMPGLIGCGGSDGSSNPLVATWTFVSMSNGAITVTAASGLLTGSITLKSDGTATGSFTVFGETTNINGTWNSTATHLTMIEVDGTEVMPYSISGNTLRLSDTDGTSMVLTK